MNIVHQVLDYFYDNKTACKTLYWGAWVLLCFCTFSLDSWLYAGALASGLVLHWSGLIAGAAMSEEMRK